MKSQIFGHWDVCCMNSAHYRKFFFFKLFHPLPRLFDLMNSCLDFFLFEASIHCLQPEGVSREDQGRKV